MTIAEKLDAENLGRVADLQPEAIPAQNAAAPAKALPAEPGGDMAWPDLRTLVLAGILVLAAFYTMYFAREILVPIFFAFILNLLLQPAMRWLARVRLPRVAAAVLMILLFFGAFGIVGVTISRPAADWIAKAPASVTRFEQRFSFLEIPLEQLQDATKRVEELTQGSDRGNVSIAVTKASLGSVLLLNTQSFLLSAIVTIVLLFFLLVAGDMFLRRLVEIMPKYSNKKQLVEISQEIERNISGYLFTVTAMNAAVGVLTGLAAYAFGLSDPILWGVAAFLLNYLPIFGPLLGVCLLFLAGLDKFDNAWEALLPAASYLLIHFIEGEFVTPMLLARRFTLNPVLVIISIVFWYWMWGVAGALLAVPLLAMLKIICDRIQPLAALGHFIGADPPS